MTDLPTLREIVRDGEWLLAQEETLVERELARPLLERAGYEAIDVVAGVRRAGKSKLLLHMGRKMRAKGMNVRYINFEDERFSFGEKDAQNLSSILDTSKAVLLLDEPQNLPRWERWARRLHDRRVKLYITGSNSQLLGSELATAIGGRKRLHEVFPFSFREVLAAKGAANVPSDQMLRLLGEYMSKGGYPYPTVSGDYSILNDYRNDILERDILARHGIRDPVNLRNLSRFIMSNPGLYVSSKSIKGFIDLSHVTLRRYLDHFAGAYSVIPLEKFSHSRKEQLANR